MGVKNTQELKALQVRLNRARADLTELRKDKVDLELKIRETAKKIGSIEHQINTLTTSEIVVSEHAILRFLERAMGFDVEQIKQKILDEDLESAVMAMGNGKYPICENLRAVVRNGTVVSVI